MSIQWCNNNKRLPVNKLETLIKIACKHFFFGIFEKCLLGEHGKKGTGKMGTGNKGISKKVSKKGTQKKKNNLQIYLNKQIMKHNNTPYVV